MAGLLPAAQLASKLQPYKRLLGVLVRQDCISLAVSNPYLNLAEPLGGLMLRDGRLSTRAFQRLLGDQQSHLTGFLIGCEVDLSSSSSSSGAGSSQQSPPQELQTDQLITAAQRAMVKQIQGALLSMSPGLAGGWQGSWSAAGASCRLIPPGGPAAATAAAATSIQQHQQTAQQTAAVTAQQEQQRCSLGQQFLQDYLDGLGALNTFG